MKTRSPWRSKMMIPFYLAAVMLLATPARAWPVYPAGVNPVAEGIDWAARKIVHGVQSLMGRALAWLDRP